MVLRYQNSYLLPPSDKESGRARLIRGVWQIQFYGERRGAPVGGGDFGSELIGEYFGWLYPLRPAFVLKNERPLMPTYKLLDGMYGLRSQSKERKKKGKIPKSPKKTKASLTGMVF